MSKKSLAFRLSLYISLAIITVLLVLIIIVYKSSQSLFLDNVEKSAIIMNSTIINEVDDELSSVEEVAKITAQQFPFYMENGKGNVSILLTHILEQYEYISAIYLVPSNLVDRGKNRIFASYVKDQKIHYIEFSPDSGIFRAEIEGLGNLTGLKETTWTEPFISKLSQVPVSMFCHPIILESNTKDSLTGYILIELSLNVLSDILGNHRIGKSGLSFIVSGDGTYLAHPDKTWIVNKNFLNPEDLALIDNSDILKEIMSRGSSGNLVVKTNLPKYKKSWLSYSLLTENDWKIIIVIPYQELFKGIWFMVLKISIISLLSIIIIFFLITYISRRLMNPLAQIASDIHEFSTAGRIQISKNEAETLRKSFTLIKAWYEKFQMEREKNKADSKLIRTELRNASEIVNNIIPSQNPEFLNENIEIYSSYKPANIIGGDFYDYVMIDDSHLLIAIGDVSGKGISGALFMSVAHTILKRNTGGMLAKNIVKSLNEELAKKNPHQYFLTLFVGVLDLNTGLINYCNAAHTSSMVIKSDGNCNLLTETHGLPLGLYQDKQYSGSVIKLSPGDSLFLYTDGITEMLDSQGQRFGEKRLKKSLTECQSKSPIEIVNDIETNITLFRGKVQQVDDYCMVALKFKG